MVVKLVVLMMVTILVAVIDSVIYVNGWHKMAFVFPPLVVLIVTIIKRKQQYGNTHE